MFVSKLMVRSILAELQGRGLKPSALVAEPEKWLSEQTDPRLGLRGRDLDVFIERAYQLSHDPALGLTLGLQAPETTLHVLGHLLLTCKTVREAFAAVRQYAVLMIGGIEWYMAEKDRVAIFGFSRPNTTPETARFWADWMLGFALRIGRHYAHDPKAKPIEVLVAHSAPTYAATYGQIFGCPVHFDQPSYGITFRREFLDVPHLHADPMLSAVLKDMAEQMHRQVVGGASFAERVRQALRYESDLVNVDFDRLASRWGMTRRTLRRRLSEEGQSLSDLLDEACCRQAKEELRRQDESIKEIAERLGYSETSAFHRAFKRWTGQTPTEYRASVGAH